MRNLYFYIWLLLAVHIPCPLPGAEKNSLNSADRPARETRTHTVGTLWNTISNYGISGSPDGSLPSMVWPGAEGISHARESGLWVAATVDSDTVVVQTQAGQSEWSPAQGSAFDFGPGLSAQDGYCLFDDCDTSANHTPLGLTVHQRTLSWDNENYDDFIAYEYVLINTGDSILHNVHVGWRYDGAVSLAADSIQSGMNDLVDYDGWHSAEYQSWHGREPNLITIDGSYVDIVENIDINHNGRLDGYDAQGVPFGDPYNPRFNESKIHPDGYPDEWQVYAAAGDTFFIPRNTSYMYDYSNAATGYVGARLLYASLAPFHATSDDSLLRPSVHQWWKITEEPDSDSQRFAFLTGTKNDSIKFMQNPLDSGITAGDYCFLIAAGPWQQFAPGDSLTLVLVECVGKGLRGLRHNMDQALIGYYRGSMNSSPIHPAAPDRDVHWGLSRLPQVLSALVEPPFVAPGTGSFLIKTIAYDPDGTIAALYAEICSDQGVAADTLQLFDDGLHQDGSANDSLFAGLWPAKAKVEKYYTVNILCDDNSGDRARRQTDALFTTVGPLHFKEIVYPADDKTISPGERIALKLRLQNFGVNTAADQVHAVLKIDDPYVHLTADSVFIFPQSILAPAGIGTSENSLTIEITANAPHNHSVPCSLRIFSRERLFWQDAFQLTITDDKPPVLADLTMARYVSPGKPIKISAEFIDATGIKKAQIFVQTLEDSILDLVDLTSPDSIYSAEWTTPRLPTRHYDVDLVVRDWLNNEDTLKNVAGFSTRLFNKTAGILIVDDDDYNNPNHSPSGRPYEMYYQQALDSCGFAYDVYSVYYFGTPDSTLINSYLDGCVIWETGDARQGSTQDNKFAYPDEPCLTQDEINVIAAFLDHGGRLFLSGQGIGYDSEKFSDFFRDVFKSEVRNKSASSRRIEKTSHFLTAGFPDLAYIKGGSGADNQMYPTGLTPVEEDASPIFNFTLNEGCAGLCIENDNGSRIIYLSFGFEAIAEQNLRSELMLRAVYYLLENVSVTQQPASAIPRDFALRQNYPNPFNPSTTILFDVPYESHVRIDIFNVAGATVATVLDARMAAGSHKILWSGYDIASGIYFIRMRAQDFVHYRKMIFIQ